MKNIHHRLAELEYYELQNLPKKSRLIAEENSSDIGAVVVSIILLGLSIIGVLYFAENAEAQGSPPNPLPYASTYVRCTWHVPYAPLSLYDPYTSPSPIPWPIPRVEAIYGDPVCLPDQDHLTLIQETWPETLEQYMNRFEQWRTQPQLD